MKWKYLSQRDHALSDPSVSSKILDCYEDKKEAVMSLPKADYSHNRILIHSECWKGT